MTASSATNAAGRADTHRRRPFRPNLTLWLSCLTALMFCAVTAFAQSAGEGAIQGTVTDPTGAVVPDAAVTATNVATGVKVSHPTSSSGLYVMTPLLPGIYTVDVKAAGFQAYRQQNIQVDALNSVGLNITLKIGDTGETVDVSTAPPQLDTTNGTLGGTIQGTEYMELPLLVSGNQQRDITQFSNLQPGAQPGTRSSVIGGTGTRLGELYVDGLPLTSISQQGDNRPVFNVIPLEAIDQIKVVTSGFSAEYQGAGLENYNLKSGTNKYHGTVADFVRNTIFDTWGFSAPYVSYTNAQGVTGPRNQTGSKPADHQNELSISFGGPVRIPHLFDGRDKLFFQLTLDKVNSTAAPTYGNDTLPTTLMRAGDFTELLPSTSPYHSGTANIGYTIYDPTTQTCPTSTTCTRQPFMGMKNGIPTPNVIPASEISPIAQKLQSFLPPVVNGNVTNNYVGGIPGGYRNLLFSGKVDYDISSNQRLSVAYADGRRHAVPYTSGSANLPVPYLASTLSTVAGNFAELEHTITIRPNLVNQFKVGYQYFGGPPVQNITEGNPLYEATSLGITNLPAGQASDEFPGATFAGSNAQTAWAQPAITNKTVTHTFDVVDNVEWVIGRHALNFGIQLQDLMENFSSFNSPSSPITLAYSNNDTAQVNGTAYSTAAPGYAYASFLLGAVSSTSTTLQPFSDIGDRYHPISPYFQDDFKVTPKLTLNLGLRWDYLPGFRETADRWSFLNATQTNPYTGNLGSFQFAGNYGGPSASCGCSTPVNTYWKNFGPRLGFAYSVDDKTVFRGGAAILYSHGGGTGGAAANATGQTGFSQPVSLPANTVAGPTGLPEFYLNTSGYNAQLNNSRFGGPTYTLPAITPPSATSQLSTGLVGNFVNGAGAFVRSTAGVSYADPYYGDRTPTFYFYNFGIQRSITSNITVTANYAGSITHFIAGASNLRGLQSGQINPKYLVLATTNATTGVKTTLLNNAATPANVAAAQAILPGCCAAPYAGFTAAAQTAAGAAYATIGQGLKWMPQYSSTADPWGSYSANAVYNAFEFTLAIRPTHGLTLNINYTYNKELDDTGTQRSGYAIPGSALLSGQSYAANRIDRSVGNLDQPENLAIYGVYKLPFGKGGIGNNSRAVRWIAGGWEVSGIGTYLSGVPLFITSSACTSSTEPGQGQCMPDVNPNFTGKNIRVNGKWGQGVTATTLGTLSYLNGYVPSTTPGQGVSGTTATACTGSTGPFCNSGYQMIGDAPRAPFNLRAPSNARITGGVRRTFDITSQVKFTFGVDVQNLLNSVTFGGGGSGSNAGIGQNINTATFGTLGSASSDSRDFQFSGRISF
jgi:hypothetical protein